MRFNRVRQTKKSYSAKFISEHKKGLSNRTGVTQKFISGIKKNGRKAKRI